MGKKIIVGGGVRFIGTRGESNNNSLQMNPGVVEPYRAENIIVSRHKIQRDGSKMKVACGECPETSWGSGIGA